MRCQGGVKIRRYLRLNLKIIAFEPRRETPSVSPGEGTKLLRQLATYILIAQGLTVVSAALSLAQSPAETRVELGHQIRQAVEDLHAVLAKQRRAEAIHLQRADAIQRQIELLQQSLQPVTDAAKMERQEMATLEATINEQEELAERARAWINHTADAVAQVAERVRQRVRLAAGGEKLRRLTEVNKAIELLGDGGPPRRIEGIHEFLRVLGDEWLPARSVTLGNEAVFTDGDQKMEHAWVVGFGLAAKVFVTEDSQRVGIWSGKSDADWNLNLPEDARQQVRELVGVVREQRPPAVAPLPVMTSPAEATPRQDN